jgi:hypothetical protein
VSERVKDIYIERDEKVNGRQEGVGERSLTVKGSI